MGDKRIALVIGIDSYEEQPLGVCVNDAHEIMATLSMPEYGFEVFHLLDREATRKNMLRKVDEFFHTPADTYLLYFTGHGLATDLGAFLCPVDVDTEEEAVDLEIITRFAEKIVPSQASVILILDCCHAGAASIGKSVLNCRPLESSKLGSSVSLARGRVLFAACSGGEAAYTAPEVGHSLFTSFILRALLSEAADSEGRVTVGALHDFVSHACSTSGLQTPVFKGEFAGPFILRVNLPPGVRKDLPEDKLVAIEREAENHLIDFQAQLSELSRDLGNWKEQGHKATCQMLEPILLWLHDKKNENPTLLSRQRFLGSFRAALQRLAALSALEAGLVTREGALKERLGSGLFGTVWKVDRGGLRPLAYKVYHPQDLHISDKTRRFERGYRAMKQLDHPQIVRVHDYTNCPLGFYMDYIDGPNLRDFMGPHLGVEDRVTILMLIADTLRHSHSRGVCHRDVKPENILVTFDEGSQQWKPYLTDFDLAWFPTGSQLFTKTAMGSLYYAAPEQITKPNSAAAHDFKVDLFSFGQLCFFVATESDPGALGLGEHSKALERKLHEGWNAEAAGSFFQLYSDCTQQDPERRPSGFSEVGDTLYKIAQSFRQMSATGRLSQEVFLRELVFAMVGLEAGMDGVADSFLSTSGKTAVRIQIRREAERQIDLQYEFHSQVEPRLDGSGSFGEMRRILAGRIETALRAFSLARKRHGDLLPFQIFVDHDRVPATKEGLLLARRLISRVLEIIEGS